MDNFDNDLSDSGLSENDVLNNISTKVHTWTTYFQHNNDRGRMYKNFLMGNQWESKEIEYYKRRNKRPLTFNKLYAFVMQLIGEQRVISPSLKVIPINYKLDDPRVSKMIDLREDIVKSIEYNSRTNLAYQMTYKNQLEFGYGALMVCPDYLSENSFDQELRIIGIRDPERCYWDLVCDEIDKSDGEYCGYVSYISKSEFKKKYPNIDLKEIQNLNFVGQNNTNFYWITQDNVTVADHFQKIWKKKKIYRLSDNSVVDDKNLESELKRKREILRMSQQLEMLSEAEGRPLELTRGLEEIKIEDERTASYCDIKHYRIVRNKIIEENIFPGKYLPIVFVDGDSYYIEGKQYTRTFIQFAEDAQRFINYCASETMNYIRGGRKEKFLATKQHTEGYEAYWSGLDNDNVALYYNPDPRTERPTYIPPFEIPQTLLQQYQRAENDLYTILGRYEAVLGAKSKEISGIALDKRIAQGNITALLYPDNLLLAQNQIGRIILNLLPIVYDTYRTVMIDKDESRQSIEINKRVGKDKIENEIDSSEFEIEITAGSSFATQKAESYAQLMDLISKIPEIGKIAPDLAAANLNLSNTPKLVERIRKHLIPQIAMAERGEEIPPPQPDPQEVLMRSMAESEQKKADASLLSAQSRMIKAQSDVRKDFSDNEAKKIKAAAEVGKAQLDYASKELETENKRLQRENEAFRNVLGSS